MTPTNAKARELGQKIYDLRAKLAAEPEVSQPGIQSERDRKIELLDIAAAFNGLALK